METLPQSTQAQWVQTERSSSEITSVQFALSANTTVSSRSRLQLTVLEKQARRRCQTRRASALHRQRQTQKRRLLEVTVKQLECQLHVQQAENRDKLKCLDMEILQLVELLGSLHRDLMSLRQTMACTNSSTPSHMPTTINRCVHERFVAFPVVPMAAQDISVREIVSRSLQDLMELMIQLNRSQDFHRVTTSKKVLGWHVDTWIGINRFYSKTCKLFPDVDAFQAARFNFTLDESRLKETFPEVQEISVLRCFSDNVMLVRSRRKVADNKYESNRIVFHVTTEDGGVFVGSRAVYQCNGAWLPSNEECTGYHYRKQHDGCLITGIGGFSTSTPNEAAQVLDKEFSQIYVRWEGLYINPIRQDDWIDNLLDVGTLCSQLDE